MNRWWNIVKIFGVTFCPFVHWALLAEYDIHVCDFDIFLHISHLIYLFSQEPSTTGRCCCTVRRRPHSPETRYIHRRPLRPHKVCSAGCNNSPHRFAPISLVRRLPRIGLIEDWLMISIRLTLPFWRELQIWMFHEKFIGLAGVPRSVSIKNIWESGISQ